MKLPPRTEPSAGSNTKNSVKSSATRKAVLDKRADYFRTAYQQARRDGKDHRSAASQAAHDAAIKYPLPKLPKKRTQ